ncbi:MAG: trigger factor family protein, partial [Desulfomonilaceae bacterium]
MATIVVEDVSPIKKRVTFEVPEETVRNAIESQYLDLKKTVQIKGFRKGKAPLQIIKGYFRG